MSRDDDPKLFLDEHGQPFPSYKAFCEARPPFGLGYDPLTLETMIAERKTAEQRAGRDFEGAHQIEFGSVNRRIKQVFHKGRDEMTAAELERVLEWLQTLVYQK